MSVRINIRNTLVTSALALTACTGTSGDSKSEVPLATTRQAIVSSDLGADAITSSSYVPRSLDKSLVTVVAKLDGMPTALHQEALGRKLTRVEKDTLRAQRLADHASVRPHIARLGGRVITSFTHAINGLKIEIPRNQLSALRAVPGVVEVKSVTTYTRNNDISVPRIHAPDVWAGVFGIRGEGVKVAVIDTGIDYTHANFGGPGTVAAFQAAQTAGTGPADPTLFGENAPKVKGGTDLVGDNYDANSSDPARAPVPDPNPLDCNGHGSHVAGTSVGLGVLADGTTFHGPYDPSAYTNNKFAIGPGVAPKADLYSVRVFGCTGSTNVVTEALEWAVDNDMDVVNMSLGSPFGTKDDADSEAADNAVKAGVIVVASAGNDSDVRYIAGGPAHSTRSISVAASDAPASNPGATIALPSGSSITAINANGATFADGTTFPVRVLRNPNGTVSLGCNPAEYAGSDGKLVVVARGTCARVARAVNGQKGNAAAVLMINNAAGLPPFEGKITQNPDTGENFNVTIPFFGVSGPVTGADARALVAADGQTVTFTGKALPTGLAGFTSGGPRNGDSMLKPDVTGPGIAIVSTAVGSGNQGVALSGTSMASPHVAGVAALTLQAHPKWKPAAVKAAIINSGAPGTIVDYATRRAGSGLVNAASSARTAVYAEADSDLVHVNFGLQEFATDFSKTKTIRLHNTGSTAATFNVGDAVPQGSPHSVSFDQTTITVPARSTASVALTLNVPAATAGDSSTFRDVAGLVTFTPVDESSNFGVGLSLPYYMVPRVSSSVRTVVAGSLRGSPPTGSAVVDNTTSLVPATADFYAWGLTKDPSNLGALDLRAAGVQTFGSVAAFAINTYNAWSTASTQEFDVNIDSNLDGTPDFVVFGIDIGRLAASPTFDGRIASAVFNVATGAVTVRFLASTSTDTSTIILPFNTADVGLSAANARFSYSVASFDLLGTDTDSFPTTAAFNAFSPAISTGQFVELDPNGKALVDLTVNPTEFAATPALGIMVVTPDNKNGKSEATLAKVKF